MFPNQKRVKKKLPKEEQACKTCNILKESVGRSRDNKKFPTASSNGRENESVSVGSGQIMKGLC